MRVIYIGQFKVNGQIHRLAEIDFSEKEEEKTIRIAHLMTIKGWGDFHGFDGAIQFEVSDREEYNEFMTDWKASKKCITNCMKYGF